MKLHDVVPTTKGRPTSKVATTTYDNAEAYGAKVLTLSRPATGSLSLRNWKTIRACAKGSSDLRGMVDGTLHGRKLNANNNVCIYMYIYIYILHM